LSTPNTGYYRQSPPAAVLPYRWWASESRTSRRLVCSGFGARGDGITQHKPGLIFGGYYRAGCRMLGAARHCLHQPLPA
jgi:hypothetical protein